MKSLIKNNSVLKRLTVMLAMIMLLALSVGMTAFAKGKSDAKNSVVTVNAAAEDAADDAIDTSGKSIADAIDTSGKAVAAAIAVGLAAGAGAIGMGLTIAKSEESIARQPEAEGKIRTTMMLGLVFIETAIIYALVISILIIFVM